MTEALSAPRTCGDSGGMTKAGAPCRTTMNLSATGQCVQHDETRRAERAAMTVAGGLANGKRRRRALAAEPGTTPPVPETLEDAASYFAFLVNAGATGAMDARLVHECSFALKGFQSALEKRDLLREMKQLRADLAAARKDAPKVGAGPHRG